MVFCLFNKLDVSFDGVLCFGFDVVVSYLFDTVTFIFVLLVLVVFTVWFVYDVIVFGYDALSLLCFSSLLYLSLYSLFIGSLGLFIVILECLSVPVILFFVVLRFSDWFVGLSFMMVYSGFTGLFGIVSMVGFAVFDWFWSFSSLSSFFVFILVISLLVKSSFYPFHSWLPYAHGLCGTGGSVFLAGVFLKLGGYGLVRLFDIIVYSSFLFTFQYFFLCLSFFGMVVSSIACIVQVDVKKLIAFSSVCHMNFTILVLFLGGLFPSILI